MNGFRVLTFLLIFGVFVTPFTYGQLGLKNKIFGKKKKGKAANIELDYSTRPFKPSVGMYSLLDNVKLELDGKLSINKLDIFFLPAVDVKGNKVDYNPVKDLSELIWVDIIDTKSKEAKARFHFSVGYVAMPSSVAIHEKGENEGYQDYVMLTEGEYELKFYLTDDHFYTFPFTIIKKMNDDPYSAMSTLYFIEGKWDDYAYIDYSESVWGTRDLVLYFYLKNQTVDVKNQAAPDEYKDVTYLGKLKRDGQLIGATTFRLNDAGTHYLPHPGEHSVDRGDWDKEGGSIYKYPWREGRGDEKNVLTVENDLIDGQYELELWIQQATGEEETIIFPFVVKDKRIVPPAEANRSIHKDPTSILEQGPEYFFIQAKK